MQEYEKNYIECRFYVIGDRNVGKKSFIDRLLGVPSTSLIRNFEAEKEFNERLYELLAESQQYEDELMNINDNIFNSTVKEKSNTINNLNKTRNIEKYKFSKTRNNFDVHKKFLDYNPNNIEEKNSKFMIKSFIKTQILTSKYRRPPIPEHPSKLFNINKSKIILKPYYLFPAEELPDYYNPTEEDTSDFVLEGNNKISLKGINRDIYKKSLYVSRHGPDEFQQDPEPDESCAVSRNSAGGDGLYSDLRNACHLCGILSLTTVQTGADSSLPGRA